jgi:hypothetical protein
MPKKNDGCDCDVIVIGDGWIGADLRVCQASVLLEKHTICRRRQPGATSASSTFNNS